MPDRVKVYKIEVMVIDHDGIGEDDIKEVIENTRYPNYCISPEVVRMEGRDVEWSDAHPLNQMSQWKTAFNKLFGEDDD